MNASKEGTRRADGPKFPKIGTIDLLDAMKNHDHWKSPLKGENVGRGVAIGFWFNGGNRSTCTIGVNPDGTQDELVEFFEVYEKLKVAHVNVFHRIEPNAKELKAIKEQVKVKLMEMEKEMAVELQEKKLAMEQAVKAKEMIPERMKLEMDKAKEMMKNQLME